MKQKEIKLGKYKLFIKEEDDCIGIEAIRYEPSSESGLFKLKIHKTEKDGDGVNDIEFKALLTSTDEDVVDIDVIGKDMDDEDIEIFSKTFHKKDYDGSE